MKKKKTGSKNLGQVLCNPGLGGWCNARKAIIISDLSVARPKNCISRKPGPHLWTLIPYQAEGLVGNMLCVSDDTEAPTVSIPLGVKGWHAIYVGILEGTVLLKLSSDSWNVARKHMVNPSFKIWNHQNPIEEVFFKVADLTGQKLHISQVAGQEAQSCQVAYIKLIPLTQGEVSAIQSDWKDKSNRRLTATIDGFSFLFYRAPRTTEEILEQVEVFRNTDFDTLVLQLTGADAVNYRSKYGYIWGENIDVFPSRKHRRMFETVRNFVKKGINPTKVVLDAAHEIGLKVHVSIRPACWTLPGLPGNYYNSPFYMNHPEWRCRDRDGTVWARMSFAVPEVRRHLVELLQEAVRFGADGVNIIYSRGVPLVMFEEPFCKLFREHYGKDPKKMNPNDSNILKLRAEIITTFMQEVRAMLDEEEKKRANGKRLELSTFVLVNRQENCRFGLDIKRWVDEGLTDAIYPHRIAGNEFSKIPYDMDYFRQVIAGTKVSFRPAIYTWVLRGAESMVYLRKEVTSYYDAGADGITFWDACSGSDKSCQWPVISRCGHKEEIRRHLNDPAPCIRSVRVCKLGEYVVKEPYGQGWGF